MDDFKITLAADYAHKTDDNGNGFRNLTPAYDQAVLAGFLNAVFGATPALPAGFIQGSNKNFTSSMGIDGVVDDLDWGGSATAVWNGPGVDLTSISAYRFNDTHLLTELSGATVPLFEADVSIHRQYFYQELRAISTVDGVLPDAVGPGYWLANLRAGVRTSDNKLEAAVFFNNVSNASYYTYGSSAAVTGTIVNWGNPRVIGGELTVHF